MGRLKGISTLLSPDLLHVLASMGHGDEIVLADANFPTSSVCRSGAREIRADGHGIPEILEAILTIMPLEAGPVKVMAIMDSHKREGFPSVMPIWKTYSEALKKVGDHDLLQVERFEFYEQAKRSFAVVHTGETSLYGNLILKMGFIP